VSAPREQLQPVRVAPTWHQAEEWALVLGSAGIAHVVAPDARGSLLLVARDDVARAHEVLSAYDEEQRTPATVVEPSRETEPYPWMSGVTIALLLIGTFAVTGPPGESSRWFTRGAALAGRIAGDEPWRAVTALTLHTDGVHVLSNAVATAVLLPPLVQRLGLGVALCLVLCAGAFGNVLSAFAHDPRHLAVGASTAAFGAIGALAVLRLLPSDRPHDRRRGGWVVVMTALLLLALLGTARDADVLGHACGLAAGTVVGFVAGGLVRRPPGMRVQSALALLAALAVTGAWHLALRAT
jgi:membrane associated rhomboid family serine protease